MSIKNFPKKDGGNIVIFLLASAAIHAVLFFFFTELRHRETKFSYSSVPVDIIDIFKKKPDLPGGEIVDLPPALENKKEEAKAQKRKERLADRTMHAERETSPKPMPIPIPRTQMDVEEVKEAVAKKEDASKDISYEEESDKEIKTGDVLIKENIAVPDTKAEDGKGEGKAISRDKLYPSDQRLAELEKEYQKGVPGVEEGKTLNLNTSEFRYISYLTGIKRKIELVWNYPDPAARAGQQGKLELAFTIRKDGVLENVTLVKSSGYPMLDDEAVSAIKVAAPFNEFPKGFNLERITIAATFEYIIQPYFYKQIR